MVEQLITCSLKEEGRGEREGNEGKREGSEEEIEAVRSRLQQVCLLIRLIFCLHMSVCNSKRMGRCGGMVVEEWRTYKIFTELKCKQSRNCKHSREWTPRSIIIILILHLKIQANSKVHSFLLPILPSIEMDELGN